MSLIRFMFLISVGFCLAGGNCFAGAIHSAVSAGDVDAIAGEITKDKSVINQLDENGKSPLHIAVEKKDAKIFSLLLARGANASIKDRSGKTILRTAVESDSVDCAFVIVTRTAAGYMDPLLDIRREEGQAALREGVLAKANRMLGRLVMQDPANENVNFAYGMTWLSLGDPSPAGSAFERVLQINPKNDRARVELARARIVAKRYPEAKKELEKVLVSALPADVKKTVEVYLMYVKSHMIRWYYSGKVDIAGFLDSNVNVGPDSDYIRIAPVNVLGTTINELYMSDRSKPTDSTGVALSAMARAMYDMGEPNDWFLTADGNCYRNWLDESDYETGSAQAGVGVRKMFGRSFVQVPARARYIEYGGDSLVWIYGLYPSIIYAPASMRNFSLVTLASVELREFDVLTTRDGTYVSLGEIAQKSFASGKYSLYGGVEVQQDAADSEEYEYNGAGLTAGGDTQLPWGFKLMGEARYFYRDYKGKNILAPEDRKDDQYQLSVGVSRNIAKRFAVMLGYTMINNDSTFDLYEYDREITTLSTSIKF